MEKYNYESAIRADILDYLNENYTKEVCKEQSRAEFEEQLYDELWIADSVTGNASGSYTFNTWQAAENLVHNWDLLADALAEFGCEEINPIEKGEEWCDVTIRCYLLASAIADVLNDWWE